MRPGRWIRAGFARAFLAFVSAGALCAGCDREVSRTCSGDNDCAHDQQCDIAEGIFLFSDPSGTCATPCDTDASCPFGQYCDHYTSSNDFPQCRSGCRNDEWCTAGTICREGQCVPGCRDDTECSDGMICKSGDCVAGCRADDECPDGGWCLNDVCNSGCRSDAECAQGTLCAAFFGVTWSCLPSCSDDSDCAGGLCLCTRASSSLVCEGHACLGGATQDAGIDASLGDGGTSLEASTP